MSEYQYYEFQAIDRPLTPEEMTELRSVSSRARITSASFVNVYNWGDFKGDPDRWIEQYFDAFLYLANWGSRRLMFRVPKDLLDPETVAMYCNEESLICRTKGDHLIVSFFAEEVEDGWVDGEGWLPSMVSLRSDLIHGDLRCLYVGWLRAVQEEELDVDEIEPPLPPGLGQLNAQLENLVEFLDINGDLIASAAEKSPERPAHELSKDDIAKWVRMLPSKEKNAVLRKLLERDEPHIAAELRKRAINDLYGNKVTGDGFRAGARRTVGQLVARAESIAEEKRRREAERQAREKAERERAQAEQRKRRLESLVGNESSLWAKVDTLIATRQPKRYDAAISLLQDLHDVADMNGKSSEFALRMNDLHHTHTRKTSLVGKFREAKLLD